jgi:serine/threonine protein kinase
MSEDIKDLLSKLLEKDPKNRIGTDGGVDEIMAHPWFAGFDFDGLEKKELDAPFIPTLSDNQEDVGNFDNEFTEQEVVHSQLPDSAMKMVEQNKNKFDGFNN